jgi:hypothetical protein
VSKRENDAVADVLTNPENQNRSAEEVAELAIEALDEVRAKTHRLAVVGQISFSAFADADEERHTVVLGPFSARGILDTQEKFRRATEGGSAARSAGQDLAWDSKTGKGRGRFMLAPAFLRPRSAWDFFRPPEAPKGKKEAMNLLVEPPAHITETIARWQAGLWADEVGNPAGCVCGVGESRTADAAGYTKHGVPTGRCEYHQITADEYLKRI